MDVDGELPSTEPLAGPISTEFLGRVRIRGPNGVRGGRSLDDDSAGRRERCSSWTALSIAGEGEETGHRELLLNENLRGDAVQAFSRPPSAHLRSLVCWDTPEIIDASSSQSYT